MIFLNNGKLGKLSSLIHPHSKIIFYFRINNYRRRFFCSPDDKESCLKTLGIPLKKDDCFFNDTSNQKLKNSLSTGYMATFKDDGILKSKAF